MNKHDEKSYTNDKSCSDKTYSDKTYSDKSTN